MQKVSVIIPVYNVESYHRPCLDFVINQTLRDVEIICVNDGFTDGCDKILAEYATLRDVLLHPLREKVVNAFRCLKDRGFFLIVKRILCGRQDA